MKILLLGFTCDVSFYVLCASKDRVRRLEAMSRHQLCNESFGVTKADLSCEWLLGGSVLAARGAGTEIQATHKVHDHVKSSMRVRFILSIWQDVISLFHTITEFLDGLAILSLISSAIPNCNVTVGDTVLFMTQLLDIYVQWDLPGLGFSKCLILEHYVVVFLF